MGKQKEFSYTVVGRHGSLYTDPGCRKPFVFGTPLPDRLARIAPFELAGHAAIDARCPSNKNEIGIAYARLVLAAAQAMKDLRTAGRQGLRSKWDTDEFINGLKAALKDGRCPDSGFLFDIPTAKKSTMLPLFIYDVARELGVDAGVAVSPSELGLAIWDDVLFVKELRDGEGRMRIEITALPGGQSKDRSAPIYDPAQLQSSIYSVVAIECMEKNDFASQLALCIKAIALCPENSLARLRAAAAYLELGSAKKALRQSQIAIRLNPYLGEAHSLAGKACAELGNTMEAASYFQDAVANASADKYKADYLYNLAACCFNLEQYDEALRHANGCVELEKSGDSLMLRSRVHDKLGNAAEAMADLIAASAIDSSQKRGADGNTGEGGNA
ncbi:MAG: tetratricopeptide repeat protein [Candidatus Micrarchaeia archaeon]|jgi:Tfp pilus assembly protein PilF